MVMGGMGWGGMAGGGMGVARPTRQGPAEMGSVAAIQRS